MSKKRIFDYEIANELAKKHNIPKATIRTWKHRGYIPSKWFQDSPTLVSAEKQTFLERVFKSSLFVIVNFSTESLANFRHRGRLFTITEYEDLMKELKEVRKDLNSVANMKSGKNRDLLVKNLIKNDKINFIEIVRLGLGGENKQKVSITYNFFKTKRYKYYKINPEYHYEIIIKGCKEAMDLTIETSTEKIKEKGN